MMCNTSNRIKVVGSFENFSTVGLMTEMVSYVINLVVASQPFEFKGHYYQYKGHLRGSIKTLNPKSNSRLEMTDAEIDAQNTRWVDEAVKYNSEDFMFDRDQFDEFVQFNWAPSLICLDSTRIKLDEIQNSLAADFKNNINNSFKEYLEHLPKLLEAKSIDNFYSVVPGI